MEGDDLDVTLAPRSRARRLRSRRMRRRNRRRAERRPSPHAPLPAPADPRRAAGVPNDETAITTAIPWSESASARSNAAGSRVPVPGIDIEQQRDETVPERGLGRRGKREGGHRRATATAAGDGGDSGDSGQQSRGAAGDRDTLDPRPLGEPLTQQVPARSSVGVPARLARPREITLDALSAGQPGTLKSQLSRRRVIGAHHAMMTRHERSMLAPMSTVEPLPSTAGRLLPAELRVAMKVVQSQVPADTGGGSSLTKALVIGDLIVAHQLADDRRARRISGPAAAPARPAAVRPRPRHGDRDRSIPRTGRRADR